MKDRFEKLFDDYEKLIDEAEKDILINFKEALEAAYELLGEHYRKYEEEGHLTYNEMVKYNRLEKFFRQLDLIINEGYKKSFKGIEKSLIDTYTTSYNGVKDIVELRVGKGLIPMLKEEVIKKALTNDISGLKWTQRMNLHRDTAVLKIRETVTQGLHQGETYSTMAKRLNDSLSKQVVNPIRIVRTESHRVFSEARKDSLDKAKDKVKMTKTWITARDERVRGRNPKDTMDHAFMDKVTIPYDENFKLPDGAEGFAPGQIGDYNDINCRCDWIIDFIDDNENIGYNIDKEWLNSEFSTEKLLDKHYKKHLNEYGDITKEEYLNKARRLLASPVEGSIEGFANNAGFIFRYNKDTNDFAIGRPDGNISTLFKPDEKTEYWQEQIELFKDKEE